VSKGPHYRYWCKAYNEKTKKVRLPNGEVPLGSTFHKNYAGNINPLKPSGKYIYVPPALTINNSAFCIYAFRTILNVNSSDYFLKQSQSVDLRNGEVLCFLCGTDWILKYYLDELRLQRVNKHAN
jgi:hypothetical protein